MITARFVAQQRRHDGDWTGLWCDLPPADSMIGAHDAVHRNRAELRRAGMNPANFEYRIVVRSDVPVYEYEYQPEVPACPET